MMKRIAAALAAAVVLLACLPCAQPHAGKAKLPKGAYGLWEVDVLGTVSPLYKGNISTKADQAIVDRENSACWRTYGKGHAIYDHQLSEVGGGSWCVNLMEVGTYATLTTAKSKTYYQCTAIWLCSQTKYVMKYEGETVACRKGDVICVSCADEDKQVYVAYFKKVA